MGETATIGNRIRQKAEKGERKRQKSPRGNLRRDRGVGCVGWKKHMHSPANAGISYGKNM